MDESQRNSILSSALDVLGVDKYNRLISAVDETLQRGSFRFWQDEAISKLKAASGLNIASVEEYASVFQNAAGATKQITFDEFLSAPSRYYYTEPVDIPDAWITQAWEQSDEFRENVTYEYAREASKNGEIECLRESLQKLVSILPFERSVEIYCSIRDSSPHREEEFRPTFKRIFGSRMSDFPPPLTDSQVIDMLGEDVAREMGIERGPN